MSGAMDYCGRGVCAAMEGHDGTCAEASGWDGPCACGHAVSGHLSDGLCRLCPCTSIRPEGEQ